MVVAKRVEEAHSAAFARCRVSLQIHIHHENRRIYIFLHFFVLKFCVLAPVKVVKNLIKFCMQPVQIVELLNLNRDDS